MRMNYVVSRIAEVSMNKVELSIVSMYMIGQMNDRSLLVMIGDTVCTIMSLSIPHANLT